MMSTTNPTGGMKVHLRKGHQLDKETTVDIGHAHALAREWINTLTRGDTFTRPGPRQ